MPETESELPIVEIQPRTEQSPETDQQNINPVLSDLPLQTDPTITADPESIIVVGATGLTGSRFVKALSRVATENQTIYVLSRDIIDPQRPNVIQKNLEAAAWPEAIAKIPNVKVVFSSLGARPRSLFAPELSVTAEEFYLVTHNLNVQIAQAAKDAGATTFVLTSCSKLGYAIPKLIERRVIMRAATERDIIALKFPELIILRPGRLVGLRDQRGTLSMINWTSVIHSFVIIGLSPFIFLNPLQPADFFNFGTSVGKAAVVVLDEEPHAAVKFVGPYDIIRAAAQYNAQVGLQVIDEFKRLGSLDENELSNEKFERLNKLLFGWRS